MRCSIKQVTKLAVSNLVTFREYRPTLLSANSCSNITNNKKREKRREKINAGSVFDQGVLSLVFHKTLCMTPSHAINHFKVELFLHKSSPSSSQRIIVQFTFSKKFTTDCPPPPPKKKKNYNRTFNISSYRNCELI